MFIKRKYSKKKYKRIIKRNRSRKYNSKKGGSRSRKYNYKNKLKAGGEEGKCVGNEKVFGSHFKQKKGVLTGFDDTKKKCTKIEIPKGITSIGDYALANISRLTSITIPDSVTSIGEGAFAGCTRLTSITIPNSVKSIGKHIFYKCSNLASLTLSNRITSIPARAFYGCDALKAIILPDLMSLDYDAQDGYNGWFLNTNGEPWWERGTMSR